MKYVSFFLCLLSAIAVAERSGGAEIGAQGISVSPGAARTNQGTRVVERGAHHRVEARVDWVLPSSGAGPAGLVTNWITVLGQGMHYRDAAGDWVASKPVIQSYPGGIVCTGASYRVILSPNLNRAGAVDLETPDGTRVVSHPLALYFYDPESGRSVLLARLKDSRAEVVSTRNEIVYRDAFQPVNGSGVEAAVTYRYDAGRFAQDVTLTTQPAVTPAALGLGSRTRLEVVSEILRSPAGTRTPHVWRSETNAAVRARMVEPDLVDETLTFGPELTMTLGWAFPTAGRGGRAAGVPVAKRLVETQGRTLLRESVEWNSVRSALEALPGGSGGRANTNQQARLSREWPELALAPDGSRAPVSPAPVSFASRLREVSGSSPLPGTWVAVSPPPGQGPPVGFVIDYTYDISGYYYPHDGFTFYPASTCTYLVESYATICNAIFQSGAVIKYGREATLWLTGDATSFPYSGDLVVFTAEDDNTVGAPLGNGNPQGFYASCALNIFYASYPLWVSHVDIRFAQTGAHCFWADCAFNQAKLAHCGLGFYADQSTITLDNTIALCNVPVWYDYDYYGGSVVDYGAYQGCGPDTDFDGMPDSWELANFGDLSQGPNDDYDNDDVTNLREYQLGRNPLVPGTVPDSNGVIQLQVYSIFN